MYTDKWQAESYIRSLLLKRKCLVIRYQKWDGDINTDVIGNSAYFNEKFYCFSWD